MTTRTLHCDAGDHQFTHEGLGRPPKDCPRHKAKLEDREALMRKRGVDVVRAEKQAKADPFVEKLRGAEEDEGDGTPVAPARPPARPSLGASP